MTAPLSPEAREALIRTLNIAVFAYKRGWSQESVVRVVEDSVRAEKLPPAA